MAEYLTRRALQEAIEKVKQGRYRGKTTVVSRPAYDALDLLFVEQCNHRNGNKCSVCRVPQDLVYPAD